MRQRHRQWLAAMALSFPVCSVDSYSSSVMPANTPSLYQLLEQRQTNMDVNMFLSSKSPYNSISSTNNRFGGRASGTITATTEEEDSVRTLGFDTRLHLLDSSKWNAGTAMDPTTNNNPIKNQSLFSKSSVAWLPWIPTLAQIQALKLTELKQACAERGLKKVCCRSFVLLIMSCADTVALLLLFCFHAFLTMVFSHFYSPSL